MKKKSILIVLITFILIVSMLLISIIVLLSKNKKDDSEEEELVLSDFYIEKDNNIFFAIDEKLNMIFNNKFCTKQIYEEELSSKNNATKFHIFGELWNNEYSAKQGVYTKIDVDWETRTYKILSNEQKNTSFQEYQNKMKDIKETKIKQLKETIQKNEQIDAEEPRGEIESIEYEEETSNIDKTRPDYFEVKNLSNEDIIKKYYRYLLLSVLFDTDTAYSMISKECKEEKFKTIEEFKSYINTYQSELKNSSVKKYLIKENQISISNGKQIFILNINGIMEYTFSIEENEKIEDNLQEEAYDIYINGNVSGVNLYYSIEETINSFYCKNNKTFKAKTICSEVHNGDEDKTLAYYIKGTVYGGEDNEIKQNVNIKLELNADINKCSISSYNNSESEKNEFSRKIEELSKNIIYKDSSFTEINKDNENFNIDFNMKNYDKIQYLKKHLDRFVFFALYDREYIYNYISDNTKKLKFNTLEKFSRYVNEHSQELKRTYINSYDVQNHGELERCIIKDRYNTYYIFDVTNMNDYTITIQ